MKYYTAKTLNTDFDNAIRKTRETLKSHGFGVLSEIKIHEKLKEKIDVDFRRYTILGACNPTLAHKALQVENKIGTMLPCNVIVQELDKNKTEVAAVDPHSSMQVVENNDLTQIAKEVQDRLNKVIDAL